MVHVEWDPYPFPKVSGCHFGSDDVIAAVGGFKIDTDFRKRRDLNLLITLRSSCLDPLALATIGQKTIYFHFVLISRKLYCRVFSLGALWALETFLDGDCSSVSSSTPSF